MSKIDKIWMVRAGEQGYLFDDFIAKSIIAVGWNEIGDLTHLRKNSDELKDRLKEAYPEARAGQIDNYAGQINRFRFEINKDELVITYNPSTRTYRMGRVLSDYQYVTDKLNFYHVREVAWEQTVQRDRLSTGTRNSLGSTLTIFKLTGEVVNDLLKPDNVEPIFQQPLPEIESQAEELDALKDDIEAKAREFIKDKLLALEWDKMQDFVAGLLRAMGYRSFVSPKGMDRGRDITASTDGLGLEDPKIVVEVKHRKNQQMSSQDLRSFIGGLRPGEKGIYVSTGGFTKDAKYEADRSDKPLTIVDSDRLVTLIIDYYDKFDVETRLLVPLKKLYWPL